MNKQNLKKYFDTFKVYFISGFASSMGAILAGKIVNVCEDPDKRNKIKNKIKKPFKKKEELLNEEKSNVIKLR